jgi:hypothetical protein
MQAGLPAAGIGGAAVAGVHDNKLMRTEKWKSYVECKA